MVTKSATVAADPVVQIEGLRQQIAALQQQIKELADPRTLRPREEAEAYIRELVRVAGAQGGSSAELVAAVASRLSPAPDFGIPEQVSKRNPFSLMCELMPEMVARALCAGLAPVYDGSRPVMSASEQGERRRALEEQLFDVELEEEQLISAIESQGRPAPQRRGDANPAAVLHETTL